MPTPALQNTTINQSTPRPGIQEIYSGQGPVPTAPIQPATTAPSAQLTPAQLAQVGYSYDTGGRLVKNATTPTGGTTTGTTTGTPTQQTFDAAGLTGTIQAEDPTIVAARKFYADQANAPFDPDKIKADTLAGYQGQIDALKSVYAQKLSEAKVQGQNRLGQAGVSQAMTGLIGSGSQQQQNGEIQTNNTAIENSVTDEENAKIAAITNTANSDAAAAIKDARDAKIAGGDKYIASITQRDAVKAGLLQKLAAALLEKGKDPNSLSSANMKALTDAYAPAGFQVSQNDIISAYKDAQAAAAKAQKDNSTTLSQGQSIIGPDGKVIASVDPKKETEIQENVNGRTVLVDKATGAVIKDLGATTSTKSSGGGASNSDILSYTEALKNGTITVAQIPQSIRGQVLASFTAGGGAKQNDLIDTTVSSLQKLNDLVNSDTGFSGAVGAKGVSSLFGLKSAPIAGTKASDFDAALKQAKNDVILPNLKILHGLGRVTDREFQALTSAVTDLDTTQSQVGFKNSLKTITDRINTIASTPQNTQSQPSQINYQGKLYNVDAQGNLTPA